LFLICVIVLTALATGSNYEPIGDIDGESLISKAYIFQNVCLDIENNRPTIVFYADPEDDIPPISNGPIASLGGRAIAYLRNAEKPFSKDTIFDPDTLVLYSSQGNSISQLLLDTLYGAYWGLYQAGLVNNKTGEIRNPDTIALGEVGRPSLHNAVAKGVISNQNPSVYRTLVGRCYSKVIVGNAGYRALASIKGVSGMRKPEDVKETFNLFRTMLREKSKSAGDEDYGDSHVLVSHRMQDHRIANCFDIIEAVGKIADAAQIAFLSQLPFFGRVQMIKASSVFVTSHSEDMLYASFLDPRATVVEIIPYGCTDDTWERFCKIYGIKYLKWQNTDRSKTKFKPGILTRLGIDPDVKKKILEADHFDPETQTAAAAAYWDDQDTTANVDEVIKMIKDILPEKKAQEPAKEENGEEKEENEVKMEKDTHEDL